nr:HAD phosphatase, family IIIA [Cryptococcus depauperatus CBS 7841]
MPPSLSNTYTYLSVLIWPSLLRPHLRVPSISHVDFRTLKKEGFNAVVIDKDNCLTLPHQDEVWPPYQRAWEGLLKTFEPGRVLVVSNSAGTRKDPGGIAAEAVSLSLRAPVLLHTVPKPGCASNILSYFEGKLDEPYTLQRDIVSFGLRLRKEEEKDKRRLWNRWEKQVSGPLLGGPTAEESSYISKSETISKSHLYGADISLEDCATTSRTLKTSENLRILVIGDRLFTDTLLANRLSSCLLSHESESSHLPRVLSIYTTSLPQPRDVRILRWVEERLSRNETQGDYTRFIRNNKELDVEGSNGVLKPTLWEPTRFLTPAWWREINVPPLTWHPRSWKILPLTVAVGRLLGKMARIIGVILLSLSKWGWERSKSFAKQWKERVQRSATAKEVETSPSEKVSIIQVGTKPLVTSVERTT